MDYTPIKKTVEGLFDEFVNDLELLTNIDSTTGNIEGSRKISKFLQDKIKSLGGSCEVRDNGRGAHVIAKFKGDGKKQVLLIVHTDTVMGTEGGKRLFEMDKNKIAKGAGVGDCKASAIQMLYLIKAMNQLKLAPYSELVIYFDAEEEGSSPDEIKFAKELAANSDYAIICDTGRPNWGVCTQRKATGRYTIDINGISGHAGNAPQASASSALEAALIATQIFALASPLPDNPLEYSSEALKSKGETDRGQFIPENCVNIASISTNNDKYNIIPDKSSLKVEVRCYKQSEQVRIDNEIKNICSKPSREGITITISGGLGQGPMEKTPASGKLFEIYKDVVKNAYNAEVAEWIAGGLTIGNTTSLFVPTIDALGVDVEPQCEHTINEWVDLKTFAPRTAALIGLIKNADKTTL